MRSYMMELKAGNTFVGLWQSQNKMYVVTRIDVIPGDRDEITVLSTRYREYAARGFKDECAKVVREWELS